MQTIANDNRSALPDAEQSKKARINRLREQLQVQREAFAHDPFPSEKLRRTQLKALKSALLAHKDKLIKAVHADFGCRSFDETLLADIMPTVMTIDHALAHLRQWMQPEPRKVGLLFQPASARIMYQPLGVVGIMSPWNYPVYLSLGPLVAAIAAGNRAMIKPSEFCPYSNRVIRQIIEQAFPPDEVTLVEGDADVAAAFSSLPFDHLLFTGSTAVGKKVMAAAAANLTPVTLELGGKSPALIAPDVSARFAAERMLFGKTLNAGQTCVTPDYVLCPEDKKPALIAELRRLYQALYPNPGNGDYTSIINDAQYERLQDWLADAQQKGGEVIPLADPDPSRPRHMPLTLVSKANSSMRIMQEEIFGPILPIIGYNTLSQALECIHHHERPLALYLFTLDKKTEQRVLMQTHAGGVCINDTVNHVAIDDLPFGGVGPSGMGQYHAHEGFKTFSKAKPILKRGRIYSAKLAFPPFNRWIHRLIYRLFL